MVNGTMYMNRIITLLLLFLTATETLVAQTLDIDNRTAHFEFSTTLGLNNDGWQWDAGIVYFPIRYVGLKASLGIAGEIEEFSDWNLGSWNDDDDDWMHDYDSNDDYTTRFKFTPSIVLRTPRIVAWRQQGLDFYLFAEPGIILSPGARGSHRANTFGWDLKSGINAQLDELVLSLGYGITDFSLYSGRPINHHGLPAKDNYITHSVFVGFDYKF